MGRGDKRTAKGKRFKASYGNSRPHRVKAAAAPQAAATKKAKAPKKEKEAKGEKPKKTVAKKAPKKKEE